MVAPSTIDIPSTGGTGGSAAIDFTYYVSPTNGSNATGDGSISKPYLTIAFAIAAIPPHGGSYSVWAFERWTIHLEPGYYTEVGPLVFRQIRRSIRLYGDGAVVDAPVTFINDLVDYPTGILFSPALVPAPWGPPDNTIPLPCFELAGESGGMEGGYSANNLILRGRVLYRTEGVAGLTVAAPFFWFAKFIQSLAGFEFENACGGAASLTVEIEGSSIINRHIGCDGVSGAAFLLKAHNSQLRGTIGPFCTILEIDSCRIQSIDRLTDFSGGAVVGSVVGSTVTNQVAIVDSCFSGTVYNIGAAAGSNVLTIDDTSLQRLIAAGFVLSSCVFQPTNRLLRQNRAQNVASTLLVTDKVVFSTPVAPITLTLPTAASYRLNTMTIKNLSLFVVTVDGSGAETIDGALSVLIVSQYESLDLYSDGVSWSLV